MIGSVIDEPKGFAPAGGPAPSVLVPGVARPVALSPELVDLLTEAVVMPATAATRAEVVRAMLLLALDAVRWRQELGAEGTEESSLLGVLAAAEAHRQRMADVTDHLR